MKIQCLKCNIVRPFRTAYWRFLNRCKCRICGGPMTPVDDKGFNREIRSRVLEDLKK